MAELEKVIDALKRCESYGYCNDEQCPYYKYAGCLELLRNDALTLLKAQEPRDLINGVPTVPAVPLDKLCEYLNSVIYPCIICKESPGPQCNAKRKGCWERVLTKWMEEQDAAD